MFFAKPDLIYLFWFFDWTLEGSIRDRSFLLHLDEDLDLWSFSVCIFQCPLLTDQMGGQWGATDISSIMFWWWKIRQKNNTFSCEIEMQVEWEVCIGMYRDTDLVKTIRNCLNSNFNVKEVWILEYQERPNGD